MAVAVPIADQGDEIGFGEGERLGRFERVQQFVEGEQDIGLVLAKQTAEGAGMFVALALEGLAEAAEFFAVAGAGIANLHGGVFADEIELDIDIADMGSGAANALEQGERLELLLLVRGQVGQQGEQFELGFDAAGTGAEVVHLGLAGMG